MWMEMRSQMSDDISMRLVNALFSLLHRYVHKLKKYAGT